MQDSELLDLLTADIEEFSRVYWGLIRPKKVEDPPNATHTSWEACGRMMLHKDRELYTDWLAAVKKSHGDTTREEVWRCWKQIVLYEEKLSMFLHTHQVQLLKQAQKKYGF